MKTESGTMFPALQYNDAIAAIEWLCLVLGFEKKLVVPGVNNTVIHAQLKLGAGLIMLGNSSDDAYGKHIKTPMELNGVNTQSPFIYIEEIEAHYQEAVAQGAEILIPLREEEYGGKYYLCKDPEGYLWSIGSYDPMK